MQTPSTSGSRYAAVHRGDSLADVLERVLDRGVVIAGDIVVSVVNVELLTLKLRLIVASVETAREIGLDWWTRDPFLSSRARGLELEAENRQLRERLEALETRLEAGADADRPRARPGDAGHGDPPAARGHHGRQRDPAGGRS